MSPGKTSQKKLKQNKNFAKKIDFLSSKLKKDILKEIKIKKIFTTLTISCLLNVRNVLVLQVIEELLLAKKIILIQYSSKEKFYIILNSDMD
uniref:40S ribosomal protein S25 n=1 Tax=Lotharella vacuolata TaxID=74820 RepID=A0A0H5BK62_9EUKA|nr:hypothetical protein [Lotharella vacuolata]